MGGPHTPGGGRGRDPFPGRFRFRGAAFHVPPPPLLRMAVQPRVRGTPPMTDGAGGGGGGGGQGCIRKGGGGAGRGVWLGPPYSKGPPIVPAKGGPKNFQP